MSLTLNGLTANSMRWLASWSGVWTADLDIEAEVTPSGRVVIASTEGIALVGTIDSDRSGKFGEKSHARVIGGGAGWQKSVRAQHYNSSIGVPLAVLVTSTASAVGEIAVVLAPITVGPDFARGSSTATNHVAASQIFTDAGVDWWVGLDGVTRVGMRPPLPPPVSLTVLDWDPATETMRFTADVLVEPGTVLVDERFGTRIVRQVEALVSGGSVTGTLWVADSAPMPGTVVDELGDEIAAIAREATRATWGRLYEYRVIAMAGDRVELQAVRPLVDGVPNILPGSVWAGVSGYRATLRPASRVLVGFIAGDPKQPYVSAYEPPEGDGWRPVKIELDALASVEIGALAGVVTIGTLAAALPIARAPAILAHASALQAAITAAAAPLKEPPVSTSPVLGAALAAVLDAIATAIGTANTALAADCPSKKVVAS